jgi:hypothetical protein
MSAAERREMPEGLGRIRRAHGIVTAERFWVYISCAALAVLTSYLLGKEMMWDNLDYHLYAGFSALHDRFGSDYFAAGVQSYLNPYVYAPYYLLATTGLPALWVASSLAVVQSGILWLTYELACAVSPPGDKRTRIAVGACAALLALANPILIDQLGSSFADIITAEISLAGWLLLVLAVRTPSAPRVLGAGLLLGVASALKLTNSLHALSACMLLLFLPASWSGKMRLSVGFIAAVAVSFAAVAAPWAVRLNHQFGNPFFPLLNNIFRSPHFPAIPLADYRFVPSSFAEMLSRPFVMSLPTAYVDDEYASPDIRYALLLLLALMAFVRWIWQSRRAAPRAEVACDGTAARRAFVALACAFLVDWLLWLHVSGNGRYFLAMACVAGVLVVVLAFRIFTTRRDVLGVLLTAVFMVQGVQLAFGTQYRTSVPWDRGPWFEVSVPAALQRSPDLFFIVGEESESFVVPFLAAGSGVVNLDGDYVLGPTGVGGARIQALIRRYAGHIRVAAMAGEFVLSPPKQLPDLAHANDTLAPFGLRVDETDCSTVTTHNMRFPWRKVLPGTIPLDLPQIKAKLLRVPQSRDGYLVTCQVVPDPGSRQALANAESEPDLVFDRMEGECPQLFQPLHPVTQVFGDVRAGYLWMRKYPGTDLTAVIVGGSLRLADGTRGGRPEMLGPEADWAKGPLPLACGRHGEHYYAKLLAPAR